MIRLSLFLFGTTCLGRKKFHKNHKKISRPRLLQKICLEKGSFANNHTASAASRLDSFLLFSAHVVISLLLHTASTARPFPDHTYNDGSPLWNGPRPVTAYFTI